MHSEYRKLIFSLFIHYTLLISSMKCEPKVLEEETNTDYWRNIGENILKQQLEKRYINGTAKNVVFFLGDGMSIPTITAARIYAGQLKGQRGEEWQLSFEKFPFTGLAKTYCIDGQVADSACTATSYLGGVKTNVFTIGVNGKVLKNHCRAATDSANHVDSIAAWAQKAGKATGIVTTTRVTHASPAGAYAHTSHRDHESDSDIERIAADTTDCRDIAKQMILDEPGKNFDVIFGGGRQKFLPVEQYDEEGIAGNRTDGLDLISVWKKQHPHGKYITTRKELLNLPTNRTTDRVLGLFASSHLDYNLDNVNPAQPSLREMTEAAIRLLSKQRDGYFLFVEGGLIDVAHHATEAAIALDETVQFSEAIQAAVDLTNRDDTLIVVTSDHSHTMSINGFPYRGTDILGFGHDISDLDHLPYFTLSYANGLGSEPNKKPNGERVDPRTVDIGKHYRYPAIVPLTMETHGGDDVGVFAIGPHAHLFVGNYEQNAIPAIMAYASCIGTGLTACEQNEP